MQVVAPSQSVQGVVSASPYLSMRTDVFTVSSGSAEVIPDLAAVPAELNGLDGRENPGVGEA